MNSSGFHLGFLFNSWWQAYGQWLESFTELDGDMMRRFIRHPADIPIAYTLGKTASFSDRLRDVSQGGLCFTSEKPVSEGSQILIEIPIDVHPFEAVGTVAWCRRENNAYAVGVAFNDNSTQYSVRMIEQICHIEHYRSELLSSEGRELSAEEAAKEWVEKFAADFPH